MGIQKNGIQSNSSSDEGPSTSFILMKDPLPQWQNPQKTYLSRFGNRSASLGVVTNVFPGGNDIVRIKEGVKVSRNGRVSSYIETMNEIVVLLER